MAGSLETSSYRPRGNESLIRLPHARLAVSDQVQNTGHAVLLEHEKQEPLLRKPNRKTLGSEAFNLEYDAPPTRDELRADVVSYLGEYRLQVQKYDYGLVYGRDKNGRGPITIRDDKRSEDSMQSKTKRGLAASRAKNLPTHREEAENVGLALLNEKLRVAKTGDTVVWASPPGPKEQGYGEYGFVYVGKVTKFTSGEAHLAMTAIRIEKPREDKKEQTHDGEETEEQKRKKREKLWTKRFHNVVSSLTEDNTPHNKAEDFIARPQVVGKGISEQQVHAALNKEFSFESDPKEKDTFKRIVKQMEPLIDDFLDIMEDGSADKKLQAFYKLENYALKLKEDAEKGETIVYQKVARLDDLSDRYKYRPPDVAGSCKSTKGDPGSMMSNGLISAGMGGKFDLSGESKKTLKCKQCPLCGASDVTATIANGRITCPSCSGSAEYKC